MYKHHAECIAYDKQKMEKGLLILIKGAPQEMIFIPIRHFLSEFDWKEVKG